MLDNRCVRSQPNTEFLRRPCSDGLSAPKASVWIVLISVTSQSVPHKVANRTSAEIERQTLQLRRELKEQSDLGEFGAAAIHREMERRNLRPLPAVRTISYILQRYGALDYHVRQRNLPPPLGWYLPEVVAKLAELDQFDFVEGLVIKDGPEVEVLNVVSLHGSLVGAWPTTGCTAESARTAMIEHWRQWGLPDYAQFDNDTRFQGPHAQPDTIGTVIKFCLSLGLCPSSPRLASTECRTRLKVLTGAGRRRSGPAFTTTTCLPCKHSRSSTSQLTGNGRLGAWSNLPCDVLFPSAGSLIRTRKFAARSS